MTMEEQWRPCPGFPTYEISSLGRIRRLIVVRGKQPIILKPWKNSMGYDVVRLSRDGKYVRYLVHRLVGKAFLGLADDEEIDHRSHDLENYGEMRVVSREQNARNTRGWQDHSSRFKGVSWDRIKQRWYACIWLDGKTKPLGRYTSELDAARAYDAAASAAWGEFAFLNLGGRHGAEVDTGTVRGL